MSAQAAQAVIDSLEFARTGQSLSGSLPLPALTRLQDFLFDDRGEVRFEVRGGHDARRRPVLTLEISGVLHLQCQRCLGALDYALELSSTVRLASGGGEADAGGLDDAEDEWIEASAALDVAELVEDEILLSLPYAPRHGEGQCPPGAKAAAGEKQGTAFAKLAALKRNNN
jgi:uncharacterized protein